MVTTTPRQDHTPHTPSRSPWKVVAIVVIAVGVVVIAALAAVVATRNPAGKLAQTLTVSVPPSQSTSALPSTPGSPSASAPNSAPPSTEPAAPFRLGYLPLYPLRAAPTRWAG